nr:MAG TPA: hypothetical protein [Caudoviricetes sp.]
MLLLLHHSLFSPCNEFVCLACKFEFAIVRVCLVGCVNHCHVRIRVRFDCDLSVRCATQDDVTVHNCLLATVENLAMPRNDQDGRDNDFHCAHQYARLHNARSCVAPCVNEVVRRNIDLRTRTNAFVYLTHNRKFLTGATRNQIRVFIRDDFAHNFTAHTTFWRTNPNASQSFSPREPACVPTKRDEAPSSLALFCTCRITRTPALPLRALLERKRVSVEANSCALKCGSLLRISVKKPMSEPSSSNTPVMSKYPDASRAL